MHRIAFYGKGGIGKTTVAANVSAMLASKGKRVLHIGCDPKGDSCRLLMGRSISTLTDALQEKGEALAFADVAQIGACGVCCVETGGPRAGVGCAGLGIGMLESCMDRWSVWSMGWDYMIYDVLGDVVCGGFSAPMRAKFIDEVFVVTSAEPMSLFAANSILRGLLAVGNGAENLGGLILNRCRGAADFSIFSAFADAVDAQVIAVLKNSEELFAADFSKKTLAQFAPDGTAAAAFNALLLRMDTARPSAPHPMSPAAFEAMIDRIREKELSHGGA